MNIYLILTSNKIHSTMIINYSPYFDGNPFINYNSRKKFVFDELFVGDAGLLSELELRSGLTRTCLSKAEREANYYIAVKEVVQGNHECFIKKSFQIDEYGVSTELLKWRDELILAGWNSDMKNISPKIDLLCQIEKTATEKGIVIQGESDRWRAILTCDIQILSCEDQLAIHFPEEYLPPHIKVLLSKMKTQGVSCNFHVVDCSIAMEGTNLKIIQSSLLEKKKAELKSADESFKIIKFDQKHKALEWLITQKFSDDTVFINSDNRSFDHIQLLFHQALSGSTLINANPEIVQLFKLGCSLFIRPLNIYNLLSYLQISVNPLPSRLRKDLTNTIVEEGGIVNERWNKIIKDFQHPENSEDTIKNQKKLIFLPIENTHENVIDKKELNAYIKELKTWANQKLIIGKDEVKPDDELISKQLQTLVNFCSAFLILLNGQTEEKISYDKLKSWILSIYKPSNYNNTPEQANSRKVSISPAGFADKPEHVVWVDCDSGTPSALAYAFLNSKEKDELTKSGVSIQSEEEQIRSQLYSYSCAILHAKKSVIFIYSEKDKGERLGMHPLMVQLYAQFGNFNLSEVINPVPEGAKETKNIVDLPEAIASVEMNEKNLFKPRASESYSSLHELIQNPLDYVLNYQAKLRAANVVELNDENRTLGNIAHQFIEDLVKDSKNDLSQMRKKMDAEFESMLNKIVLQKGAILLLEENKILLTQFRSTLKTAVFHLIEIIETNQFSIVGCEIEKDFQYDDKLNFNARVDMLLKDKDNKGILFDLKWSKGKTYYHNLIKENKALQLEVYRKVFEADKEMEIQTVAYFILSYGFLETASLLKGNHIIISQPENKNALFDQALNSYRYRWGQLQDGFIEVAEKMPLNEIQYFNDCETENLYPLEPDYSKNKIKAQNKYSHFTTFKGGLK